MITTCEEQVVYPLAAAETIADLEAYPWPNPDWYDYDALPASAARCSGRAICCGYTAPFTSQHAAGAGAVAHGPYPPARIHPVFLGRISDFFTEFHRRCFDALQGAADMTQVTDDSGWPNGLLIVRVSSTASTGLFAARVQFGENVRPEGLSS